MIPLLDLSKKLHYGNVIQEDLMGGPVYALYKFKVMLIYY